MNSTLQVDLHGKDEVWVAGQHQELDGFVQTSTDVKRVPVQEVCNQSLCADDTILELTIFKWHQSVEVDTYTQLNKIGNKILQEGGRQTERERELCVFFVVDIIITISQYHPYVVK